MNYARVTAIAQSAAKLSAARVRDELTKEEFAISARVFVNATRAGFRRCERDGIALELQNE